ncbi:Hypothetical predicted protein [Mytilus galloprovincialis]|uniref:Uncharacterized protein n=1 Tax=Mytilus galloprovincialis TaxID=29158 RepID=A0A8B6EDF9_MYTGA|nr:Hypothetical predicted protein [Mytilus galloprovincialis]
MTNCFEDISSCWYDTYVFQDNFASYIQVYSCNDWFHLQTIKYSHSICTQQVRQICSYVGLECRGNQRFDADQPHAVCDHPGRRTQGYSPQAVYQYIMQQRNSSTGR